MPPAEMQRLFGLFCEPAKLSKGLFGQRQEPMTPMAYHFDDAGELPAKSCDSLWIDVGGEG
jgi:hypothetical protein